MVAAPSAYSGAAVRRTGNASCVRLAVRISARSGRPNLWWPRSRPAHDSDTGAEDVGGASTDPDAGPRGRRMTPTNAGGSRISLSLRRSTQTPKARKAEGAMSGACAAQPPRTFRTPDCLAGRRCRDGETTEREIPPMSIPPPAPLPGRAAGRLQSDGLRGRDIKRQCPPNARSRGVRGWRRALEGAS